MKKHKFKTSQEAYDGLNKYFFTQEFNIVRRGGGRYGGQMVAYNQFVIIEKAWVNPKFDFGNTFGYRKQKWSGLLNNYIDKEALTDLKNRIKIRENKKGRNYNESMVFYNKHGHGKNCLLSLTCSRRQHNKQPIISFNLRSSEITKRLLMDLLLIQRISELLYPDAEYVSLNMFVVNMYQNAEAFTMFDTWKPIKDFIKNGTTLSPWQGKVLQTLKKFKTVNIDLITMKVHKRCVRQLQRPEGIPLSGDRPMLTKELIL